MKNSRYLLPGAIALGTMISVASGQEPASPKKPAPAMEIALESRESSANTAVVVSGMIVVFAATMLLRKDATSN